MHLLSKFIFLLNTKENMCNCKTININEETPQSISQKAILRYEMGDILGTKELYSQFWPVFSSYEIFQTSYLSFLLKTGQYRKMIELQNIKGNKNIEMIKKAYECIRILDSKDYNKIAALIEVSSDSLDANIAKISLLIDNKEFHVAQRYLSRAEKLYQGSIDLRGLRIRLDLYLGNIERVMEMLKEVNYRTYSTFKGLYDILTNITEIHNHNIQLQTLLSIYKDTCAMKSSSLNYFGVFDYLYKVSVQKIVETGCDHGIPVTSFANTLLKLEENTNSIFYYIKSLILERKIDQAEYSIGIYEKKLDSNLKSYLRSFIAQTKRKIEEEIKENQRRMEQEQRRRRMEQEQQERHRREQMYQQSANKNVEPDFLGYYKTLGVNKNVNLTDLKTAHRKKVKAASKKAMKNAKLNPQQKDEEVKVINKAFQILSDPEKRKMYDMGIDPEKGPQHSFNQRNYYSGGDVIDEDQLNEIFQAFFGGGQSRGRRGYQRTQFIFM